MAGVVAAAPLPTPGPLPVKGTRRSFANASREASSDPSLDREPPGRVQDGSTGRPGPAPADAPRRRRPPPFESAPNDPATPTGTPARTAQNLNRPTETRGVPRILWYFSPGLGDSSAAIEWGSSGCPSPGFPRGCLSGRCRGRSAVSPGRCDSAPESAGIRSGITSTSGDGRAQVPASTAGPRTARSRRGTRLDRRRVHTRALPCLNPRERSSVPLVVAAKPVECRGEAHAQRSQPSGEPLQFAEDAVVPPPVDVVVGSHPVPPLPPDQPVGDCDEESRVDLVVVDGTHRGPPAGAVQLAREAPAVLAAAGAGEAQPDTSAKPNRSTRPATSSSSSSSATTERTSPVRARAPTRPAYP